MSLFKKEKPSASDETYVMPDTHEEEGNNKSKDIWETRRWEQASKLHMQYVRSIVLGKLKAKPSFIARMSRIHADELIKEMRDTNTNTYDDE